VEIGSSEKEWGLDAAGQLIAKAVELTLYKMEKAKPAIAFGGTHYPWKFTELLLKTDYAIGHILPKYQSENFNEKMFRQMMDKSCEKIKYCIIDWKGINQRTEIAETAKKYGLEVVKI
jgi:D-aminoacyl-tRNA deacylase